ncbi:MAG: M24 family metallopeptidase, partial [Candidatus Hodarchaeota archaeon]
MDLTRQDLTNLTLSGKIAHLTLDKLEKYVKPGISISQLYDLAVKLITQTNGVGLAFPPNISINECAAHDTASPDDQRVIPKKSIVKIDIGANVNGLLSDTARTYSTDGKHSKLIKSANIALENAIRIIKPGIRVYDIGAIVQSTIEDYGYKPISNLTGHQLDRAELHAGLSIPSIKSSSFGYRTKIKKGMVLAIEPFSTNGSAGYIVSSGDPLIYSAGGKPKSEIGKLLFEKYQKLPFSLRSATLYLKERGKKINNLALILNDDRFNNYRPLIEKSKGIVAQAEHTVLVTSNGARI